METLRILTSSHLWQDIDDFIRTIDVEQYDLCFFQQLPYPIVFHHFKVAHQYLLNSDSENPWEQIGLCFTTSNPKYPTVTQGCFCDVAKFSKYVEEERSGKYIQEYHIGKLTFINCYPVCSDKAVEKFSTEELINTCNANSILVGVLEEEILDHRSFKYKGLVNHSESVNKVITRADSNITISNVDVQEKYTTFNMTFKVDYGKIKNDGY